MHRRLQLLNKKHDLIKKKLVKMEGFGEFTKKIAAQSDSIADRSELLQRYFTQKGTNERLEEEKK